jgi:hypothetical protein
MIAAETVEDIARAEENASAFPWGAPAAQAPAVDATEKMVAALPEDTMQLIVR